MVGFCALSWDSDGFLWKSPFPLKRCVTAYGKNYACKYSSDLFLRYRRNTKSQAITRCRIPGISCHQVQNKRNWPHTWWLSGDSISLSADLLDGEIQIVGDSWKMKIQLWRFLLNRLGIVPASSTSSLATVSVLANREPKSERSSEELSYCSEKVIFLFILPILLYSVLKR